MLEAYLNQREPLTVSLGEGEFIKFRNMNSLTAKELNSIIEASYTTQRISTILKNVVFPEDEKYLEGLTPYQFEQVFEQWEELAGTTLQEVLSVFATIDRYPKAFQSDLQASTRFKTITDFLSLSAIDLVTVTNSLLHDHRSYVYAEYNNLAQPMSVANTIEQILLGLFIMIRNTLVKDPKPISLKFFAIDKTDNHLDELEPVTEDSVLSKEETEDAIKRWRETGQF